MKCIRLSLIACAVMILPLPALALEEGDPALPLSIAHWVLGEPAINVGKTGEQIYAIAFWATWSKPACESIIALSEIQGRLQSSKVTIVAVSAEHLKKVEEYVSLHRDRIKVRVAVDDDQKTTEAYMGAVGQHAIPHVFVVNTEGVFSWQGHPDELEDVLNQIIAGTFEIKKKEKKADVVVQKPKPGDEGTLLEQASVEQLYELLEQATRMANWRLAVLLIDKIVQKIPDSTDAAQLLGYKFTLLYENLRDYTAAEDFAREVLEKHGDKADTLNAVAWTLLARGDFENLENRWPQIAHQAARKAFEASKGEIPAIVDTYARSLYLLGHPGQALEWQRKAVKKFRDNLEQAEEQGASRDQLREMNENLRNLEVTLDYYHEIVKLQDKMNK